jgi:hypothetical protein
MSKRKASLSNTQSITDHKIMIVGDSHARGLSSNMKSNLNDNYSVSGFVRPGVNIATQISSMTIDINLLTKNDLIIFWGGSNDVNKNNSQEGLKYLVNFVQSNNHKKHLPDVCSSSTRSTRIVMREQRNKKYFLLFHNDAHNYKITGILKQLKF